MTRNVSRVSLSPRFDSKKSKVSWSRRAHATLLKTTMVSLTLSITLSASAATTIRVDSGVKYQLFEGFGTSLCWFANVIGGWPDAKRTAIADLLFSPTAGIGINVVRYNIGGGENPLHNHMRAGAKVEGFEPSSRNWNWEADATQRWMLEAAKTRAGSDFKAEAFSNSPPYWMTVSQCSAGAQGGVNNLTSSNFDDYADYLTEVVIHFRDSWGISFHTLEPMNEPNVRWTVSGRQEGCHLDNSDQAGLLQSVHDKITQKGINIKLSAPDGASVADTIGCYNSYNNTSKTYIDQINTHGYSYTGQATLLSAATTDGKALWMSEADDGGADDPWGAGVPLNPTSIVPSLSQARRITAILRGLRPSVYVIWQAVENWPNMVSENKNWGLILANIESAPSRGIGCQDYTVTKKYYGYGQYSKFIRPGYQMVDVDDTNTVAFVDATGAGLIIVRQNSNTIDEGVIFDLSSFATLPSSATSYRTSASENMAQLEAAPIIDNQLSVTSVAQSITTYLVGVTPPPTSGQGGSGGTTGAGDTGVSGGDAGCVPSTGGATTTSNGPNTGGASTVYASGGADTSKRSASVATESIEGGGCGCRMASRGSKLWVGLGLLGVLALRRCKRDTRSEPRRHHDVPTTKQKCAAKPTNASSTEWTSPR